jgi:hypothetical protein
MKRLVISTIASFAILLGATSALALKHRIAALPRKVRVTEAFNRCTDGGSNELRGCCSEAKRSCELECSRSQTASTDPAQPLRCETACKEAAKWCRQGVGAL